MRHSGKAYHDFMLGSPRDQRVRGRFQEVVCSVMPPRGTILDFGAGTGLDAKGYAIHEFRVLVHEPSEANLDYLRRYCREEITNGEIIVSDLSGRAAVDMIVANFAVLNLIGERRKLFARFADALGPGGFVLVSVLNPFFLGDIRYFWWWRNLYALVMWGAYAFDGESGLIYRFTPSVLKHEAGPYFSLVRSMPPRLASFLVSQYVFMLFRKQ